MLIKIIYILKYNNLEKILNLLTIYLVALSFMIFLQSTLLDQVDAQSLSGQVQSESCTDSESLIEVLSQEYGSVLWIDGIRYGFIPIKAFCLSSGLHHFAVHATSRTKIIQGSYSQSQRVLRHQVLWIPARLALKIELNRVNQSNNTKYNTPQDHENTAQLNFKSLYKQSLQDEEKRPLDQLLLASEFIGVKGFSRALSSTESNLRGHHHLFNRQSVGYRNSPQEKLQVQAELRGLKDLVMPDYKLHIQDPWSNTFNLWVQELNVGIHWQLKHSNIVQSDQVSPKHGQIRVGRLLVQHGARTNLIDGLELTQNILNQGNAQFTNSFGFHLTLANNRSQSLGVDQDDSLTKISRNRNLWNEFGLSFHRQSKLKPAENKLVLKLSVLQMNTKALNFDSATISDLRKNFEKLGTVELEWLGQDQEFLSSYLALDLAGQISHSHQKIALSHQRLNLGFKALWNYQAGDLWDQQWFTPVLWPNTYQDTQLSLQQALTWGDLQLAYGYQQGALPTWYGLGSYRQVSGQVLSIAWGKLGSAFIRFARSSILGNRVKAKSNKSLAKHGMNHSINRVNEIDSTSTKRSYLQASPIQLSPGLYLDFGLEWLIIRQGQDQAWSQAPQAEAQLFTSDVGLVSGVKPNQPYYDSNYVISGAWRILKKHFRHQLRWEARLSYAYLDQELWPELSLTWQYEQLELSAQCAKPLVAPLLLSLNQWFSYCGLQIELDTRVQR